MNCSHLFFYYFSCSSEMFSLKEKELRFRKRLDKINCSKLNLIASKLSNFFGLNNDEMCHVDVFMWNSYRLKIPMVSGHTSKKFTAVCDYKQKLNETEILRISATMIFLVESLN